jgi:hypothetical protein
MKKITVVIAESGKFNDLEILPGTTAQDALRAIGLSDGYLLSAGKGQEPFGKDEVIYDAVPDGGKIYASTPVEVGSGPLSPKPSLIDRAVALVAGLPSLFSQSANDSVYDSYRHNALFPVRRSSVIVPPERTGGDAMIVRRAETPYWEQRGWKKARGGYSGFFRTKHGSFRGKADISPAGLTQMFIRDPPECLRNHSHWACFSLREDGWYFIHSNRAGNFDLSSGILDIENILTEAHCYEIHAMRQSI